MTKIIPIIKPDIDWDNLPFSVGDYHSFLLSLNYLAEGSKKMKSFPYIWETLHFGFLVELSQQSYLALCRATDFTIVIKNETAIICGSLLDFQETAVMFCRKEQTIELRYIFDWLVLYFDSLGLAEIFQSYRRISLPDQTFILELR